MWNARESRAAAAVLVHQVAEGLPDPGSSSGAPACDEYGFDDFHLKDGETVTLYRRGAVWLNLLPVWLVPVQWIGLPESYEYAEAIEFLRRRAESRATR